MSLISLHNICLAFGGPLLLDHVSLDIQKGQRICCLGRNGAGKSTLLKVIAGIIKPDSGDCIASSGVISSYLPQEVPDGDRGTVFEVVARGVGAVGECLAQVHHLMRENIQHDRIHALQHKLDNHDGWRIETVVKRTIQRMQLAPEADFALLSGGMRRRVYIARALACEPELLLLDEPTNHLDIQSIDLLEELILSTKMTVLFVTHDRKLLRRLASRIIELDRGNLFDWACDYDTFLVRKQAVLDAEEDEWDRFDKKLAQEEVWIRRGVKARRTRNEGRVRALMRMRDERRKRRDRSGAVSMSISNAARSGELVLEALNVGFSYNGIAVIEKFSTAIMRGDRIGIIGPNGCGKTTLIKLLLGELQPAYGTIRRGANVSVVYFDQLRQELDQEKTVWENVAPGGGDTVFVNGSPKHVVSYLQEFLFTSDRVKSPVLQLSGGERNRLLLARLFTTPANVLVFDEPTNDLDTETLELLEEILLEFSGTVLVVSHDRVFLNNVVTTTFVFEGAGAVKEFIGGYDDWVLFSKSQQTAVEPRETVREKCAPAPLPDIGRKKLSYKEKCELEALPDRIEKLENEGALLNQQMADPAWFTQSGFIAQARERSEAIALDLEKLYEQWTLLENRPQ